MRAAHPELEWILQKSPYLHAKIIIRDGKNAYLGSHNLSTNSIDNNREVGILIPLSQEYLDMFLADYEKGCK